MHGRASTTCDKGEGVKLRKLIAASVMASTVLVPSAAWAGDLVGDVNVGGIGNDACLNVNINTGIEQNKTQDCD